MGLFDFVKKQFIDVIEWTEPKDGVLSYRYPMQDQEIQNGAQLTVRDSQVALFVNEGKIADLFLPGLYTLNTHTLPILTNLQNWDKAFASPFKSDLYFFSTRDQIDQKWGTPQPLTIRDQEFGPIRIRAFGNFSYRIEDPKIFHQKISGTRESYLAEELEGQIRGVILSQIAQYFGGSAVNFVDMASNQNTFSEGLLKVVGPSFLSYGLKLQSFFVESISLPEELQAQLDKRASMNLVGDLQRYTKFQTAESIPLAAANPGGLGAIGAGLGAGLAVSQAMTSALTGKTASEGSSEEDPLALIEKLYALQQKGVISKEEFESKKQDLLRKI